MWPPVLHRTSLPRSCRLAGLADDLDPLDLAVPTGIDHRSILEIRPEAPEDEPAILVSHVGVQGDGVPEIDLAVLVGTGAIPPQLDLGPRNPLARPVGGPAADPAGKLRIDRELEIPPWISRGRTLIAPWVVAAIVRAHRDTVSSGSS